MTHFAALVFASMLPAGAFVALVDIAREELAARAHERSEHVTNGLAASLGATPEQLRGDVT